MRLADIVLVVGTRPEAIKLAPVAHALTARGLEPTIVFTGQHPRLDPAEHGFGRFHRVHLGCAGTEDPHRHVKAIVSTLLPMLVPRPRLVVVQGDTSSAMGAALAAFQQGVPVAHVEAGLRTHDPALPWPEEEYRTAIDARADLLFAPTATSAANLACERVPGAVHVTGNTGIDGLLRLLADLGPAVVGDRVTPRLLVTCHRRENWNGGLQALTAALIELGQNGEAASEVVLPPNSHVAAQMERLLGGRPQITLLPPCSHAELVAKMRDCDIVLSDSGGMQEEAPALGVPMIVLRDKTERPEGLSTGNRELVGTDPARVLAAVRRLTTDPAAYEAMSRPSLPYGDGKAAPRIAAIIEEWLEQRLRRPVGYG